MKTNRFERFIVHHTQCNLNMPCAIKAFGDASELPFTKFFFYKCTDVNNSEKGRIKVTLLFTSPGLISSSSRQPHWLGLHDRVGEDNHHWLDQTDEVNKSL